MKRSRAVPLILLGTLSLLTSCGRGDGSETAELRQQVYATREDCLNDWGRDERDCQPVQTGARTRYVGPRYFWYHTGGYPVAVDHDGSQRPLPHAAGGRPGARSAAIGTMTSTARVSSRYRAGGLQTGGARIGGARHVSRGGFGGMARGFSGG